MLAVTTMTNKSSSCDPDFCHPALGPNAVQASLLVHHLRRGGFIVYSIELDNETLSATDGEYALDLAAPPHDYAQVRTPFFRSVD